MLNVNLPERDGFLFLDVPETEVILIEQDRINEYVKYINEKNIKNISIQSGFYNLHEIEFLCKCPNIEGVGISSSKVVDYSGVNYLKKLKELSLDEPKGEINLSLFNDLEVLYITWNKNIKGLQECRNLRKLSLYKYKAVNNNLEELYMLNKMEELSLTQCSINSLKGCGGLSVLRKLELNYLRNFEYLDEIEKNSKTLKNFSAYCCKKIQNYDYIANLAELEYLKITKCNDLTSLAFIKRLRNLKSLSFVDTNIIDGDLSPCIGLEYVGFLNKKHYSHKFEDFNKKSDKLKGE